MVEQVTVETPQMAVQWIPAFARMAMEYLAL
jgi:hypothetical protein